MKLIYILSVISILLLAGCTTIACDKKEISTEIKTISLVEEEEQASELVVIMQNKVYPVDLIIRPGTLVVWKNSDDNVHTLATYDGSLLTKRMLPGDIYSHVFNEPGEYEYFSLDHKGLQGRVIVK